MSSVKSACFWLVGVLKAGYHAKSSTGISVAAALTFLGTLCGSLRAMRILYHRECPHITEASLVRPWVLPHSVQPSQGQSPGHAGSVLQLFVSFTSYCRQPFPRWVVLCLTSCSGLDSKEMELYPVRYMLSLSQSFYIASRRKN